MADYQDILVERTNGVQRITINRPQVYNAFRGETLTELIDAYRRVKDDRDIGVVVLTGAGDKAFCAGGDVNWEAQGGLEEEAGRLIKQLYEAMRLSYKPTIARVNGYSIGGGNHLTSTTHIDNTVEGLMLGAQRGRPGNVYFVTDGEPVVFREFVGELLATQGVPAPTRRISSTRAWN